MTTAYITDTKPLVSQVKSEWYELRAISSYNEPVTAITADHMGPAIIPGECLDGHPPHRFESKDDAKAAIFEIERGLVPGAFRHWYIVRVSEELVA